VHSADLSAAATRALGERTVDEMGHAAIPRDTFDDEKID
jgi:hypothetical protein